MLISWAESKSCKPGSVTSTVAASPKEEQCDCDAELTGPSIFAREPKRFDPVLNPSAIHCDTCRLSRKWPNPIYLDCSFFSASHTRLDQILGKQGSKGKDTYDSKHSLASRIVNVERQVGDIETTVQRILELCLEDRQARTGGKRASPEGGQVTRPSTLSLSMNTTLKPILVVTDRGQHDSSSTPATGDDGCLAESRHQLPTYSPVKKRVTLQWRHSLYFFFFFVPRCTLLYIRVFVWVCARSVWIFFSLSHTYIHLSLLSHSDYLAHIYTSIHLYIIDWFPRSTSIPFDRYDTHTITHILFLGGGMLNINESSSQDDETSPLSASRLSSSIA